MHHKEDVIIPIVNKFRYFFQLFPWKNLKLAQSISQIFRGQQCNFSLYDQKAHSDRLGTRPRLESCWGHNRPILASRDRNAALQCYRRLVRRS